MISFWALQPQEGCGVLSNQALVRTLQDAELRLFVPLCPQTCCTVLKFENIPVVTFNTHIPLNLVVSYPSSTTAVSLV